MILPKENLNMTMEILGEVSVGADTMIKLPENASMTVQILDEVKDNERVPVQGLITDLLTFCLLFILGSKMPSRLCYGAHIG